MNLQENIERIKKMMNLIINENASNQSPNTLLDKILGRVFKLDTNSEPYKFKIEDKEKNLISMQIIAPDGSFINIEKVDHVLEETSDGGKKLVGYNFQGKSGKVKLINLDNIKKIIDFVDDPKKTLLTISFVTFEKI